MQRVKHTPRYRNIHWLMDEMERLYRDLSDEVSVDLRFEYPYDSSFRPIFEVFRERSGKNLKNLPFIEQNVDILKLPKYDSKKIIVCYSGGKDSLAAIRHYQKLGYDVYAYHIKGLNKAYTDEWEIAEKASKKFGFKLFKDEIGYSGQHIWIEHPMKNMLMVNMALTFGIQRNITTKIAVGSFKTARLDDNSFEVSAGDCIEMWHMYENIIKRFIPNFKIYMPNYNFQTSYRAIEKEPELLEFSMSCMTPNRFRNLFRLRTMRNYKIDLLLNRCGCCWKCATEYIYFVDKGLLEYNQKYYIHCLEVLLHTMEQEKGYRIYSIPYVWNTYMLNIPMKKSKAYEVLKDAVIQSGKIDITQKNT